MELNNKASDVRTKLTAEIFLQVLKHSKMKRKKITKLT